MIIDDVLASFLECDAIQSVVEMLKSQDDWVRISAAGLLKKFAVHGGLLFTLLSLSLLLLTIAIDDVRASNFEATIIRPVLEMLEDNHAGVRATAADLLREFAIHGKVPFSTVNSYYHLYYL